jgi:hypothetical protein
MIRTFKVTAQTASGDKIEEIVRARSKASAERG